MKAYLVYDKERIERYSTVVFAENRNQARYIALSTDTCEDAPYTDIVATRLPVADSQYNGRKEMDWCDPNDRLFLVKNCDVSCVDPEFDECLKCSAKDYCETYDDFLEEYDLCEMEAK